MENNKTTQTKRYKLDDVESSKERQLSGLFTIISNNLSLASEVLSTDDTIKAVQELESLSRKASKLAKELMAQSATQKHDDLSERISLLKQRMLSLVVDLTEDLNKLTSNGNANEKAIADIILAKRLLRESHRGLVTIQD